MDTRKIAAEYRLSHWTRIMSERKESGLSVKEFCKGAGFHENIYYYWQRKLRAAVCEQMTSQTTSAFAEVKMLELPKQSVEEPSPQLRIEVAGVRISADSGYPPDRLAALLYEFTRSC